MMQTLNDVHQQFAEYFAEPDLKPYLYTLSRKMSEGHICIVTGNIDPEQLPESYRALAAKPINNDSTLIGTAADDYRPFVLDRDRLYLQRYFHYETRLIHRILDLVRLDPAVQQHRIAELIRLKPLVEELFRQEQATFTDWQLAAAVVAVVHNFTIITGGPGTGKTTTVARILAILFTLQPELDVALAAPTGKAGARMAESLMHTQVGLSEAVRERFMALKPATIHRLLGWQKGTPYFRHNAGNPLPHDLLIVDESSMIDVALFAKLLDALKPGARIILLGDKDQLASVEAGSLFGDLCKSLPVLNIFDQAFTDLINSFIPDTRRQIPGTQDAPATQHLLSQSLVELRYSHRFKGEEGIGRLSRAVIGNDVAVLKQFLEGAPTVQVAIDQQYSQHTFEEFIDGYRQYIHTDDIRSALEQFNHLKILCAVRQGEQGINQVNARVEAYLIRNGLLKRDSEFYRNRPVMVMQNDYLLGLYNGDIGILREDEHGVMKAWFTDTAEGKEGKLKSVLPGFIARMDTVFAMTIHKSQGSEFDQVMVLLPKGNESGLLTRELLYTGITRAKSRVVIQADAETILAASEALVQRGSGLAQRLSVLNDESDTNLHSA